MSFFSERGTYVWGANVIALYSPRPCQRRRVMRGQKTLTLAITLFTSRDRALILHMCIPCD